MPGVVVNIGKDYSRYPAGRFPSDGKFNGETFRKKFLNAPLGAGQVIDVLFDDAVDYGSSFLEEAFGGLVRVEHFGKTLIRKYLNLISDNIFLIDEINIYIDDAEPEL